MRWHHILLLFLALPLAPIHAEDQTARVPTFYVGRVMYGSNKGDSCGDVGEDLVRLISKVSSISVQKEKKVAFASEEIFATPFLFMNGHDDFVLSEKELKNLNLYFTRGGFLLASGCCTNPAFPIAWRREMSRVFPNNVVKKIDYNHMIYRSFYKLESVPSANGNRNIYLEGLFCDGRLVSVLCEDGLCCSYAMGNECNAGKGLAPDAGRKLAVNIAVYALTH